MMKQRVHENLGFNQTKDHDLLYDYIENTLNITHKRCCMGCRGNKYNVMHTGDRILPIRQFRLFKIHVDKDGNIDCKNKCPLQGNCIDCDNKWRQCRLNDSRDKRAGLSKADIYQMYVKDYGNVKTCSMCKEQLSPYNFSLSIGMECGLHNTCKECVKLYSSAVSDRNIIYLTDGSYKLFKGTDPNASDDHIFPVSLGGSNYQQNHRVLDRTENIKKSNKLMFSNLEEITDAMLNDRFVHLLHDAKEKKLSLDEFKIIMAKAVHDDIVQRYSMEESDIRSMYQQWNKKNNTRQNVDRCIKKLNQYAALKNLSKSSKHNICSVLVSVN
jgi:hypothetical protein